MPIQKGIFKVQGSLDDITFYKSEDGFMVKKKTEISKERLLTDPGYKLLQQHMSEFTRAGKGAKQFRDSIVDTMGNCKDGRLTSRFTKLMLQVVKADSVNALGQRTVEGGELLFLKDFDFNIKAPLSSIFKPVFSSQADRAAGNLTIDIPAFIPAEKISSPQGSTHFKVISAGLEINFATGVQVVSHFESEVLAVNNIATAPIAISHTVTAGTTLPLFLLLGIKYFQVVNGVAYPMQNSGFNSLGIVNVDVV